MRSAVPKRNSEMDVKTRKPVTISTMLSRTPRDGKGGSDGPECGGMLEASKSIVIPASSAGVNVQFTSEDTMARMVTIIPARKM